MKTNALMGRYYNNDIENLFSNIPYCFEGKIIENNNKQLTIVINKLDNLFILFEYDEKVLSHCYGDYNGIYEYIPGNSLGDESFPYCINLTLK